MLHQVAQCSVDEAVAFHQPSTREAGRFDGQPVVPSAGSRTRVSGVQMRFVDQIERQRFKRGKPLADGGFDSHGLIQDGKTLRKGLIVTRSNTP